MADKIANAFDAAARSLRTIVAPVVRETDSLASEQLRVVAGMLDFYRDRIAYEYPRKAYELSVYCALADRLVREYPELARREAPGLADASRTAREIACRPIAEYAALDECVCDLTRELGAFTRVAWAGGADTGAAVGRVVLAHSRRLIDLRRAWFLPQGGDPDPCTVVPLATLLEVEPQPVGATTQE